MEYVFNIAKEAAAFISTKFKKPMKLLFEKVFYPYFLAAPKRYSGMKWTNPKVPDGIDTKGFEAIRRDNCAILRNTVLAVFEILGKEMDISKAHRVALNSFRLLAEQKVPISDLIISKQLGDDYKDDNHIHVQVAKYLEENYPLLAPEVGDRVEFCVIKTENENRNTKMCMKGYDPVLAQRDGKQIDWHYYAFKQLRNVLTRIFGILFDLQIDKKHMEKEQPTDFLWKPYLDIIIENDRQQRHQVNKQATMDAFVTGKKQKEWVYQDESKGIESVTNTTVVEAQTKSKQKDGDIRSMFGKK